MSHLWEVLRAAWGMIVVALTPCDGREFLEPSTYDDLDDDD